MNIPLSFYVDHSREIVPLIFAHIYGNPLVIFFFPNDYASDKNDKLRYLL